jgi:rare lipoprotein A
MWWRWISLVALAFLFASCSQIGKHPSEQPRVKVKIGKPYEVFGVTYYPLSSSEGYVEEGIASWYGKKFHNRPTANGEVYDMYAITAAHKTLPLPTWVRVTNLDNLRSMVLRINDRGPFVGDRIIDLSYAAAEVLGFEEQGTANVRVEALAKAEQERMAANSTGKRISTKSARVVSKPKVTSQAIEKKVVLKLVDKISLARVLKLALSHRKHTHPIAHMGRFF